MSGGEMSETKDPAIKLFGRTIQLPESQIPAEPQEKSDVGCSIPKDVCCEITKTGTEDVCSEESANPDNSAPINDETRISHNSKVDPTETTSKDEEKVLKRPDKVLPCPRCNSLETKFCYFNNYNVNQPRHFCKNCQRYWTAGGTIRSVPVGAGRRKNKILASQFHQILIPSDGVPITTINVSNSGNQQILSNGESLTGNGTVLSFGRDGLLSESMANVLHLTDQKRGADMAFVRENKEEPSSCSSSMTASSLQENEVPEKFTQKEQVGLPNPLPCHSIPPWGFPWNPYLNSATSVVAARCSCELVSVPGGSNPTVPGGGNASPIPWCSTPMLAVPGFCTPNRPLQLVPASYFGCMPIWATDMTNMSLVGSNGGPFLSSSTSTVFSGNNSPTLGKHCRDDNSMDEEKLEKCVFAPKTLRIDTEDEALKSSIWASLGFKSNQKESESRFGIYKSSKIPDSTQVLEANPAHHSRSQTFQERV